MFLSSCLQFKCLLSLFVQGWGQIFYPKLDHLVSQSRGAVCVRAGGGQDKHFGEEGGEDVAHG